MTQANAEATGESAANAEQRCWLSGSKVVDRYGMPLTVYHGTDSHVTEVRGRTYFAQSPAEGKAYGSQLLAANLRITNPFIPDNTDELLFADDDDVARLSSQGYDGIIGTFLSSVTDQEETIYLPFRPDQIRLIDVDPPTDGLVDVPAGRQAPPEWIGEAEAYHGGFGTQPEGSPGYAELEDVAWEMVDEYPVRRICGGEPEWFAEEREIFMEEFGEDRFEDMLDRPIATPIIIFDDGRQAHIWEGNHRVGAAKTLGLKTIKAVVGRRRDAVPTFKPSRRKGAARPA